VLFHSRFRTKVNPNHVAQAQQDALRRASSNMSSASDDSAASDESMRNNASNRV
jgi:hypothetical protein